MTFPFRTVEDRLIRRLEEARRSGDAAAEESALEELRQAYIRLGNRTLGTEEEQVAYRISMDFLGQPPRLATLGVTIENLPNPADDPPLHPSRQPPAVSEETRSRVADTLSGFNSNHFGDFRRYRVEYRPGDNKRWRGIPLPWALIDAHDGLPVAYYSDQELAELQAEDADRIHAGR